MGAVVGIMLRIMPVSPTVDLQKIKQSAEKKLKELGGILNKIEEQPIAFGLKAVIVTLAWPEDKDSEILEKELGKIKDVNSVEITDVRRVIG